MKMSKAYLSEAFTHHPLNLNHLIPLDFDSVLSVPDSHVWSNADDYNHHDYHCDSDNHPLPIPLIDLKHPDAPNLIGHACQTWGLFQVTNHGFPLSLLNKIESQTNRLFSLPSKQKLKVLRPPDGATGYGVPRIAPFFNKCMWHEGFTIMGSPVDHAKQLWPDDYLSFCDVTEEYEKKMKEVATSLMSQITKFLDMPEIESNRIQAEASSALQLNHYPPCPNPDQTMGLAPHTDTSVLTILHQTTKNGLQIFKEGIGWGPVSPAKGALVINVGDLLHILSNGRFPSVFHRVVVREFGQRLSVAYFYCLPRDHVLSPWIDKSGQVKQYRSVSVGEYIGIKSKSLEQALSFIKI